MAAEPTGGQQERFVPPPEVACHSWDTLVGNRFVADYLRRALEGERFPHAVLFSGPPGVGKGAFAMATARHLICGGWPPAGEDAERAERKLTRRTHPDLLWLKPTGAGRSLRIDFVREVQDLAPLPPLEAPRRVFVIEQAERMTPATANCLLKLLEEPPAHFVLILTTSRPADLLPTIRSRCTPLRLHPMPLAELAAWLERERGFDRERAHLAAAWAEGRPWTAVAIPLEEWIERRRLVAEALGEFAKADFTAIFRIAERLIAAGKQDGQSSGQTETPLQGALHWLKLWLRDLLISRLAPAQQKALASTALGPYLDAQKDAWTPEVLCLALEEIMRLERQAHQWIDAQLALETLLVRLGEARRRMKSTS